MNSESLSQLKYNLDSVPLDTIGLSSKRPYFKVSILVDRDNHLLGHIVLHLLELSVLLNLANVRARSISLIL